MLIAVEEMGLALFRPPSEEYAHRWLRARRA